MSRGMTPASVPTNVCNTFIIVEHSLAPLVAGHPRRRCGNQGSQSTCQDTSVSSLLLVLKAPLEVIHHDFPCVHREIRVIKGPVKLLLCHRLIGGIVIWCQIFVCKTFCSLDSLLGIENEHSLEKIDGLEQKLVSKTFLKKGELQRGSLPHGSAFLNLSFKGCLSRFGKDWTNLSVYILGQPTARLKVINDSLTFSLAMVWITSSGGVPSSSVMIENWLT